MRMKCKKCLIIMIYTAPFTLDSMDGTVVGHAVTIHTRGHTPKDKTPQDTWFSFRCFPGEEY